MKKTPIAAQLPLGGGQSLILEHGRMARQADGSILLHVGDMTLLCTVVYKKTDGTGSFLPLSVDYQEKFHARGKIPGGFSRREGKLNEQEIYTSRMIDRTIRPCFPKGFFHEVSVQLSLISYDRTIRPDTFAISAVSTALGLSSLPFEKVVAGVRIAKNKGEFIANPTIAQQAESPIDWVVSGTEEEILMIEGNADALSEEEMMKVFAFAQEKIATYCAFQKKFLKQAKSEEKKEDFPSRKEDPTLAAFIDAHYLSHCQEIAAQCIKEKQPRKKAYQIAKESIISTFKEEHKVEEVEENLADTYFGEVKKKVLRKEILEKNKRLDGRSPDEIREISIETGLSSAHGSVLFTRGDTQVLGTATLAPPIYAQIVDGVIDSGQNFFMVHYNFPGFSINEAKPNRGPGRRELGHGNLVARALEKQLPSQEEYPGVIRGTSDVLASDGSSSMASTAAISLALAQTSLPKKELVAGVAMGLIYSAEKAVILTDILSDEDAAGDADLKVTGTRHGITALQMDIKTPGLPADLIYKMLVKAKEAREKILEKMEAALSLHKAPESAQCPVFGKIKIPVKLIGTVIGPKGKKIQELQEKTQSHITIEESGEISIFSPSGKELKKAKTLIEQLIEEPEINKTYTGRVVSIQPYGAFIEFLPNRDGLLHISQVSHQKIHNLADELKENQEIEVKLISVKSIRGRKEYALSRKVLLPNPNDFE